MVDFKRIEFKAFDGAILRGNFFEAESGKAPAIVMTQGLSLLKEHYIDDTARRFQAAGISALVYDHRGYGSSDGSPRHETNPLQQAEDYHDAVTAVMSQPGVDPTRVALWGIGHSGGATMIAACDDPRVRLVILNMPFTSGVRDVASFPERLLERVWPDSLANALGQEGEQTFISGADAWNFITGAAQRSDVAGTTWENKLSLQSFYYLAKVEPRDFISKIAPRLLLYIAAQQNPLTGPLEAHQKMFENAGKNGLFAVVEPHRLTTYFGDAFEATIVVQLQFLKKELW